MYTRHPELWGRQLRVPATTAGWLVFCGQCPCILCSDMMTDRVFLFSFRSAVVPKWSCLRLILHEICMFNTQASLTVPGQLLEARDCFFLSQGEVLMSSNRKQEQRDEGHFPVEKNPTVANRSTKRHTMSLATRKTQMQICIYININNSAMHSHPSECPKYIKPDPGNVGKDEETQETPRTTRRRINCHDSAELSGHILHS